MSETATLLTGQTLEAATPSSARAKPRRRPTAEFILTLTVLADVLVIFAALRLGFWLRFESGLIPIFSDIKNAPTAGDYIGLLSMGTIFLSATFSYLRLYSRRASMRYFQTAKVVIQGAIFWLFAYLAISLILKFDPPISRLFMVSSFGCVLIVMLSWRYIYFRIIHHEFLAITLRQRVMFVGWGREADQLEMEIRNGCAQSYEVIGCVPSPQGRLDPHPPSSVPILGDYYSLGGLLERRCADIVILADLYVPTDEIIGLVNL
jgi:FlaA1/EpsC-like NDP-sugar epimerase